MDYLCCVCAYLRVRGARLSEVAVGRLHVDKCAVHMKRKREERYGTGREAAIETHPMHGDGGSLLRGGLPAAIRDAGDEGRRFVLASRNGVPLGIPAAPRLLPLDSFKHVWRGLKLPSTRLHAAFYSRGSVECVSGANSYCCHVCPDKTLEGCVIMQCICSNDRKHASHAFPDRHFARFLFF